MATFIRIISHRLQSIHPLFLFMVFSILVRCQAFTNPVLGYDEQFYLLMGDRMLHGALPYVDLFDRKPVGLFLIFAAIRASATTFGGDGFIQYKLVASLFAALTGYAIYRIARPISSGFAGGAAGALYILWLNLMEGAGGQAQVFYNLPVLLAAGLTWQALDAHKPSIAPVHRCQDRGLIVRGSTAMLLIGVALQIKYTAVFEGGFFGLTLLWVHWQAEKSLPKLAGVAGLWIGMAGLPTAAAMLFYASRGELQPFIFANFTSNFGHPPVPPAARIAGLIEIVALLIPLQLLALPNLHKMKIRFVAIWLAVALGGMLVFGSFLSSQYGMNVIVPLCIAAAPLLARPKYGRALAIAVMSMALIAGQAIIYRMEVLKGGARVAAFLSAYAQPKHGCLYVYSGFPALYMLTHSCLPTRWAFPDHLSALDEASGNAIGVDPAGEERRILATRPETIVDHYPVFAFGNPATRALLDQALIGSYHLVARARVGSGDDWLVYRLNQQAVATVGSNRLASP